MGDVIPMDGYLPEPDLDAMDREQLEALLGRVREELARMEDQEPEDPDSEAYADWGDRHEQLEDLADELMDRLDELG